MSSFLRSDIFSNTQSFLSSGIEKFIPKNHENSSSGIEVYLSSEDIIEHNEYRFQRDKQESILEFFLRVHLKTNQIEGNLYSDFESFLESSRERLESFNQNKIELSEEESLELSEFYNKLLTYQGEKHPFLYFSSLISKGDIEKGQIFFDDPSYSNQYNFLDIESLKINGFKYFIFLNQRKALHHLHVCHQIKLLLEDFSNQTTVPIALFNAFGDLYLHNRAYRDLNILGNETIKLLESDRLEREGQVFTVKKEKIEVDNAFYTLFVFIREMNFSDNFINSDELGIITGSIAHELNNPIGGILSGVEVLLLISQGLNETQKDFLSEIKSSALRCSKLVKTFLGFSKKVLVDDENVNFSEAIDQAATLLRTRLVESNINLKINKDKLSEIDIKNRSVWTMILYIIFSNLLNMALRNQLITGKSIGNIEISFESLMGRGLKMNFGNTYEKSVYDELLLSTFFFHLLEKESLKLVMESNELVFINDN